jgi:hypothetical protein
LKDQKQAKSRAPKKLRSPKRMMKMKGDDDDDDDDDYNIDYPCCDDRLVREREKWKGDW